MRAQVCTAALLIEGTADPCRSEKSKHMAIVWKKLAQHMRHVESLVIAKIEAEANEHPHLTGDAFPYALFYSAGSTQGVKYSGKVDLKVSLAHPKSLSGSIFLGSLSCIWVHGLPDSVAIGIRQATGCCYKGVI